MQACIRFESDCRSAAGRGYRIHTPSLGRIPLTDSIRFVELRTIHHLAQMPETASAAGDPD